ncbi:hypothetical protein [Streptomyces mangrovisoli]|uniref:Uncharacterized protein n=1 Tax=Streptomyces mangrovisoli TaxID=1428628 RepID=A0A1J4NYS1_9ACTN|nr:hypothetical protein [Streptomyces mangrovisoli]OIJ67202.1 hypothetical protein WN71_014450 [Streptomyces mangrovisoli]
MIEQQRKEDDQACATRRHRAGLAAFLTGLIATLVFFAACPGLPHVIDWGAIFTAVAVGGLSRWGWLAWMRRAARTAENRK